MSRIYHCECGNVREPNTKMCDECFEWHLKVPRDKTIGKKEDKIVLKIQSKCLNCGEKCSYRASMCRKCHLSLWKR